LPFNLATRLFRHLPKRNGWICSHKEPIHKHLKGFWKWPNASISEWINEPCTFTPIRWKYYSATEKNELLIHKTDGGISPASYRLQRQGKLYVIPFMWHSTHSWARRGQSTPLHFPSNRTVLRKMLILTCHVLHSPTIFSQSLWHHMPPSPTGHHTCTSRPHRNFKFSFLHAPKPSSTAHCAVLTPFPH
jgi:hypothetical protein